MVFSSSGLKFRRTPWKGDRLIARLSPPQENKDIEENAGIHQGLDTDMSVLELHETRRNLDRAGTGRFIELLI